MYEIYLSVIVICQYLMQRQTLLCVITWNTSYVLFTYYKNVDITIGLMQVRNVKNDHTSAHYGNPRELQSSMTWWYWLRTSVT